MSKYRINCTEKQARKAFSLGMELDYAKVYETLEGKSIRIPEDTGEFFSIPTADEIVGFVESNGVRFSSTSTSYGTYCSFCLFNGDGKSTETFNSRKESILAGIDIALDFLTKNLESNEQI